MQEVRATGQAFAGKQQEKPGNDANFLIAASASALAVNDARAGHEPDPDVRKLFDYLWTTQDSDGAWRYSLDGMLPFLERDQYSDRFKNYLSNMRTAYAIMALKSCKVPEIP